MPLASRRWEYELAGPVDGRLRLLHLGIVRVFADCDSLGAREFEPTQKGVDPATTRVI
jgi:hypothetical protein